MEKLMKNLYLLIFMTIPSYGMKQAVIPTKNILGKDTLKELIGFSQLYLEHNIDRLACQKNESGFVRINIPLSASLADKFKFIKKMRFNFWSPDTDTIIQEESIHSHPGYFESSILKGGYDHELFDIGTKTDTPYDTYRLFKSGDSKSVAFLNETPLKSMGIQKIQEGSHISFPTDMIHRVISTIPKTLSLNIVFKNKAENDHYNVYLTKHTPLDLVKTERDFLVRRDAKIAIGEIMDILDTKK